MPFGPFSRRDPVRVQPFYGYRNAERLTLSVRAIQAREPVFKQGSFWRGFATMVEQYLSHEVAGVTVELEYPLPNGETLTERAVSDAEGFARFDLALPNQADQPLRTRWEQVRLVWSIDENEEGEIRKGETHAWILTPGTQTRNGVISDIDDTILETGITGNVRKIARNWKRVLAQMPSERTVVPGATAFYAAIGGNPHGSEEEARPRGELVPEARVRPVFYVSSSPWNLFSYLVTFKRERGLPLGPVMLRDWGFNRKTLGSKSHGSHKVAAIEDILSTFPHLRFALIGDDTQKDLVAFGGIAAKSPDRIAAIFIRSVSGEPHTAEEERALALIRKAGVPFWTGNDYEKAADFLNGAGLDFEGGVEKLVRTASEGDAGADEAP
ncbi:MAG: phosphatase domain-containing protein [Erythrobacter sp.]